VADEIPAYRTGRHNRGIIYHQLGEQPGDFDPKVAVLFPDFEHLAPAILDALNGPVASGFDTPVPEVLRTAVDLLRAHGCLCIWQALPVQRDQPAGWAPMVNPSCARHSRPLTDAP